MDCLARRSFSVLVVIAVATLFTADALAQETRVWVGGESSWEGATNWSPPGLPGPDDTVILPNGSVTLQSSTSIRDLTVSGGTLTVIGGVTLATHNTVFTVGTVKGSGTVIASESFLWTGGVFDGAGVFMTLPGSQIEISDAPTIVHKWIQGSYTLSVGGSGHWNGSGAVYAFETTTLRVTGSLDVAYDGDIGLRLVVGAGGVVTKTGPFTASLWGVDLEPGGTLRSTGGALRFTQHAVLAGSGEISEGSEIVLFGGGEHTVEEGTVITGAGWLRMSTSSGVQVRGNASIEGISLTQGSLAVDDGVTLSGGHVYFSGGAIGGAGTVTASDSLLWTAGEFNGTGTFETLPGSHFEVSGSWKYLLGDYTISVGGTGHLGGANIVGSETATLRVTGSIDIEYIGGARVRLLVEDGGTATKIGSTTSTFWGVDLEPGGMLRSTGGSLQFSDHATLAGSGEITEGSEIALLGGVGPNTVDEGTSITGAGWLRVNTGDSPIQVTGDASIEGISVTRGLLTIDDGVTLSGGHVYFAGGAIGGVGTVTASDSLLWTAGEFKGGGRFETLPGSHLEVSGTWKYLQDDYTVSVGGTGHLGGANLGGNGGIVRVTGSLDIEHVGGASVHLVVEAGGTATKIGSTTTTFRGVDLRPGGMLRSTGGSLQFSEYATLAGSGEITGGNEIVLLGGPGPNYVEKGTSITGAGWLRVSTGDSPIQVTGDASIEGISVTRGLLTIDDGVTLSGGHVYFAGGAIGGVGTVTASDSLLWTAGEFKGGGLFETLPGSHFEVSGSWKYLQDDYTVSVGGTGHLGGANLGGSGGTVRVTGSLDIEHAGNAGTLRLLVEDGGTATKVGTVTTGVRELAVETGGIAAVEEGRLNVLTGTSLHGTLSLADPGTFGVWGTVLFAPGSVIEGTGIIYNNTSGGTGIQNGATYRPGLSPGELSFSGRLVSTADTRVEIEIGGTEPVLDYDRLAVLGSNAAELAGTLDLRLVDDFLPAKDDTFHVVTFQSRLGQFDQVTMQGTDPNDWFTLSYGATSVFLVATGGPNASPLAARDSLSVDEDESLQADLLDNDSDPNGDDLTLVSIGAAGHGETSLQDGKLLYVPAPDYFGPDTLSYRVTDGRGGFATGHVVITVLPVNDAPSLAAISLPTEGFSLLLEGDPTDTFAVEWVASTDVDGDDLTYTWQAFGEAGNIGSDCKPEAAPCLAAETTEIGLTWTMDELAVATGLGLGESIVLHHAVGTSDGVVTTWSATRSLTVERGAITTNEEEVLPDVFALHAAYPNPFNPRTTIVFDVPAAGRVRLEVVDLLGRSVTILADEELAPGVHTRLLSAEGLSSGVYYLVMTADGFRTANPVVLMK